MLLNAVIIILREVLEAALIISVFLALSRIILKDRRWIIVALILGLIAAIIYASTISYISSAMDGVGQEVVNALIHSAIYLSLLFYGVSVWPARDNAIWRNLSNVSMITAVALATAREGAEIILYIGGFFGIPHLLSPALFGSAVGLGIGLSVGVFFYYLLVNVTSNKGMLICGFIIVMLAGSMLLQSTQFLIQADLMTASAPLWDTSSLISERSLAGQLLYALVGYEATPAPIQVTTYTIGLIVIVSASTLSWKLSKHKVHHA